MKALQVLALCTILYFLSGVTHAPCKSAMDAKKLYPILFITQTFYDLSSFFCVDEQQEDDMAAEWLQMAGLSDLVTDPALTKPGNSVPRDSLSSMTVLLTLTRPQREAVLRRITSFNRAHVSA